MSDADTTFGFLESNAIGSIQDYYNLAGSRSLTSFDVAHRVVVSYVEDLPFGEGQKWLANVRGLTGKMVSGWRVTGTTTFQGGFPLPLTAQATTLQTTFGAGTTRPNVFGGMRQNDRRLGAVSVERLVQRSVLLTAGSVRVWKRKPDRSQPAAGVDREL